MAGAAVQARLLVDGAISSPALVALYLDRIGRLDVELNAFRTVLHAKALADAESAQRRLDAGERLPLLGVPVAVKDDIDVAGEVTAWGTRAHGPAKVDDAAVVAQLRGAGAIVIGKTNVPEMTLWGFTESPTYGATRNPWDPSRSPGGSSGGSAVAVAAGLASIALGSDGGGSIRTPAAWCGVFGLKPERDRVPLSPHDDGWQGLIVNGPLTRTVEDAALFLDVTNTLSAPLDGFVTASHRSPGRLRIAISCKSPLGRFAPVGQDQRRAVSEAAELLRGLGHDVVPRSPNYAVLSGGWNVTLRYLRGVHDDLATMTHPELVEPRTRRIARAGSLVSDQRAESLRTGVAKLAARVNRIFDDVDVIVTPATATGPPRIGADRHGSLLTLNAVTRRSPFQAIFNATGQPAAVVPWSCDQDGMPTAIQLVGRSLDEATLLSLSSQIEAARPWANRRPPLND